VEHLGRLGRRHDVSARVEVGALPVEAVGGDAHRRERLLAGRVDRVPLRLEAAEAHRERVDLDAPIALARLELETEGRARLALEPEEIADVDQGIGFHLDLQRVVADRAVEREAAHGDEL
jgi:hypothetical protein